MRFADNGQYTGLAGDTSNTRIDLRLDLSERGTETGIISGDIYTTGSLPQFLASFTSNVGGISVTPGGERLTTDITLFGPLTELSSIPGRLTCDTRQDKLEVLIEGFSRGAIAVRYHLLATYTGKAFRTLAFEAVRVASDPAQDQLNNLLGRVRENMARAGVAIVDGARSGMVLGSDDAEWADRDLYNLLNPQNFPGFRPNVMAWQAFCLVAPWYRGDPDNESSVTLGVMFDEFDANPRQGLAVFWKGCERAAQNTPPPGLTGSDAFSQWFVWTMTHELGHAFNLLHTFSPNKRSGLHEASPSFMNYPDRFSAAGGMGPAAYWAAHNTPGSFDNDELRAIRHGYMPLIIMGGEAFGRGGLSEVRLGPKPMHPSLSLTLRFRPEPVGGVLPFGSPVHIEAKLESRLRGRIEIIDALEPTHGVTHYYVRTPRGDLRAFDPFATRCSAGRQVVLSPKAPAIYEDVNLTFGGRGFTFLDPGRYQVQAVYTGHAEPVVSDPITVWIGHPPNPDAERLIVRALEPRVATYLTLWGNRETSDGVTAAIEPLKASHPDHPLVTEFERCSAYEQVAHHYRVRFSRGRPVGLQKAPNRVGPDLAKAIQSVLKLGADFSPTGASTEVGLSNILYGHLAGTLIDILKKDGSKDRSLGKRVAAICKAVQRRVTNGATTKRSPGVVMGRLKRKWAIESK